jgi:hypothetical protein
MRCVFRALGTPEPDVAIAIDGIEVAVVKRPKRVPIALGSGHEGGIGLAVEDDPIPEVVATKETAHGRTLATIDGDSGSTTVNRRRTKR